MLTHFRSIILISFLAGVTGCAPDADTPEPDAGLEGRWQLVNRQCYCVRTPLPNEVLTFQNGGTFTISRDGQPYRSGTYAPVMAAPNCLPTNNLVPKLRLTYTTAGVAPQELVHSISGNTLTLDYGGPCDAPVDTYERR